MSKFSDAMDRVKGSTKTCIRKLPEPVRKKADDKFGLFIHKYIATLFIFDEDIQEVYWDMEEAMENGNREKALELSAEMQSIITLKTNPESGYYSRRMDKKLSDVVEKLQDQADKIEELTESMGPRKLYNLVQEGVGKEAESPEDLAEELDLENLEEEINLKESEDKDNSLGDDE